MEEAQELSTRRGTLLAVTEQGTHADPANHVTLGIDGSHSAHQDADDVLPSEAAGSVGDAQRLLLWSAEPSDLMVPPTAKSTEDKISVSPPTSPSDALFYSLGDIGLRSAMRPPEFLPQRDWLRHLLLQAIEEAQLLFSSLWEACSCPSLGLPAASCMQHRGDTGFLDPAIAFAAAAPSAPKRRLMPVQRHTTPTDGDAQVIMVTDSKTTKIAEEHQDAHGANEATDNPVGVTKRTRVHAGTETGTRIVPTAREYISATMSWAVRQLDDPHVFPPSPIAIGSAEDDTQVEEEDDALRGAASLIVRRLLRCYAHVYLCHLPLLQQHGAVGHTNRCLKRLMFLAVDAQLLEGSEATLEPVSSLADAWLSHSQLRCSRSSPHTGKGVAESHPEKADTSSPPDDWLVPALHKAEECLGLLDREEYPHFGRNEET